MNSRCSTARPASRFMAVVVAVMILPAITAASASATQAIPVYRCLSVGSGNGDWEEAKCEKELLKGAFEREKLREAIETVPVKVSAGETTLEDIDGLSIECTAYTGSGELRGPGELAKLETAFKGCEDTSSHTKCQSGSEAGEIATSSLHGQLVYLLLAPHTVGLLLRPEGEGLPLFAKFKCGGEEFKIIDDLLCPIHSTNVMTEDFMLVCKIEISEGLYVQEPEFIEEKPPALHLEVGFGSGGSEEIAVGTTATITGEEALEMRVPEKTYGCANDGTPDVQAFCGPGSINAATGNLVESQTDLAVGGRGLEMHQTRTYNSLLAVEAVRAGGAKSGLFGPGWTSSYEAHLVINEAEQTAAVSQGNGSIVVFHRLSGEEYVANPWVEATLHKEAGTKIIDGRKDPTTFEYNSSDQISSEAASGHARTVMYSSSPSVETTFTEPNGSKTVEQLNESGGPTKITRAAGVAGVETTTEYEYNGSDELVKLVDPNKHVTEYGYDSAGDKTSEKNASGAEWKWTYDKTHDVETETTPEGETTTIKRNADGDPEVIERPAGDETQKITYKYDSKGDVVEETNPLNGTTKYTYDEAGDKESETDPEGNKRTWKYNEDSRPIAEVSPRGNVEGAEAAKFTTTFELDEQGLPVKITDPLGHTTEYKYNGDGNVETETDGNKHVTKYTYNEEDLPTKVEEANGDHQEAKYDGEGEMIAYTDGDGHTWEYKRNQLEEITEEINPLKHAIKNKYELAGNLESTEDPEKHTAEYKYDEANRLKEIKYSTGHPSTVDYEYNQDDQVTKMIDETGTTENTYDKLGRLTEYKNGAKQVIKYVYNLDNEPTAITYPNGKVVIREYDKDARLVKVTDWNKNATTFKYNPDSQLAATVFPSGTEEEDAYAYNDADQMSEIEMKKGATSLGSLLYERDGDGQVTKTTTTVLPGPAVSEDKYDEDNRLIESTKLAYEYDKADNPTKLEGTGTYSYNEADEPKEGPSGAKYAFNEDSQRTETKPGKGPATTYGYDQAGNLISLKRPKEEAIAEINDSYAYDGNNLRQSQTLNGATKHFTWDTAEAIPSLLSDETNSYIYGPEDLPIEQISSTGTTLYLHHDQQGSTRLLTSSSGKSEAAFTYNPYGTLNASTGTASTPLRYDGQYTNTDSGLIYLKSRTLEPSTAQFLAVDKALPASGQPYTYTKDNPVNENDPTGSQPRFRDTWMTKTSSEINPGLPLGAGIETVVGPEGSEEAFFTGGGWLGGSLGFSYNFASPTARAAIGNYANPLVGIAWGVTAGRGILSASSSLIAPPAATLASTFGVMTPQSLFTTAMLATPGTSIATSFGGPGFPPPTRLGSAGFPAQYSPRPTYRKR
jgi:RHS repeat-associated protein